MKRCEFEKTCDYKEAIRILNDFTNEILKKDNQNKDYNL